MDSKSNKDKCKKEAIRLALKYNFVTDVTSMVVEEDDKYVKKGTIGVDENTFAYDNSFQRGKAFANFNTSKKRRGRPARTSKKRGGRPAPM